MLLEILVGIAVVCIALYFVWRLLLSAPYSFEKFIKNGKSVVLVKVNKPLTKITLIDRADGEKLTFVRKNVEKGEVVEFVYPPSQESATLIIDDEGGSHKFKIDL